MIIKDVKIDGYDIYVYIKVILNIYINGTTIIGVLDFMVGIGVACCISDNIHSILLGRTGRPGAGHCIQKYHQYIL